MKTNDEQYEGETQYLNSDGGTVKKTDEELFAECRALDDLYADATGPAEAYERDVVAMLTALKMLMNTKPLVHWLAENDPKAMQQALKAIDDFEPWLEEAGDDPRANGWVDDKGRP